MADEVVVRSGGIGLFTALGLIFIVLKLTNVIDWSWWLVLLPIYGPWVLWLALIVTVLIVGVFVALIAAIFGK